MNLNVRKASSFIEIEVDEIRTTIFKDSKEEIETLICNLEVVIEDLKWLQEKR
jgi:hypothetical protein